ncbi:MAG: DNA-protecting protein DprA [Candidatus Harrisonbacteria bacterium]|nr:DNA-protecting protein DprA [Candidatus Harrisonbacteria bacterium]
MVDESKRDISKEAAFDIITPLLRKMSFEGNVELLSPQEIRVAIVGTRRVSEYGLKATEWFSRTLAEAGITIVSGLAYGVDAAAHRAALMASGKTIAVLPSGLSNVYPKENLRLYQEIVKGGGLALSEYEAKESARVYSFLERNRIVAGISRAVIVIEAPKASGALNTASHALQIGLDVFVVPGKIFDRNYEGSNMLIRDGAQVALSPTQILECLGIVKPDKEKEKKGVNAKQLELFTPEERLVFTILSESSDDISIDKICEITKLEAHSVSVILSKFILNDQVFEGRNGYNLVR